MPQADGRLAIAWWTVLVLVRVLPALLLSRSASWWGRSRGRSSRSASFVSSRVRDWCRCYRRSTTRRAQSRQLHWLISYDRLTYLRSPAGDGSPRKPSSRATSQCGDFDSAVRGPPMSISMVSSPRGNDCGPASGCGACGLPGRPPWSRRCWLATHWLLRKRPWVARDRNTEVREAARRLRLPTGGRAARRQGGSAFRTGLDRGLLPRAATPTFERLGKPRAPRAAGGTLPDARARGELVVFWSMASAPRTALSHSTGWSPTRARPDHQHNRLWRVVVSARWARGPVAAVLRLRAMDPAGTAMRQSQLGMPGARNPFCNVSFLVYHGRASARRV